MGILRGPNQKNLDFAVLRNFPITERNRIQFRAEFFNLFNTPNFGLPINDRNAGPAFGLITSSASSPRIIQFALKYQF